MKSTSTRPTAPAATRRNAGNDSTISVTLPNPAMERGECGQQLRGRAGGREEDLADDDGVVAVGAEVEPFHGVADGICSDGPPGLPFVHNGRFRLTTTAAGSIVSPFGCRHVNAPPHAASGPALRWG
ncbi:hypothetical protein [Saccharopolyspora shandongensis]|uniref:hypothetical protein n=1 Tax=Saccharopolyspora shandongensis TaxID=418495 RepID=UPI0033FC30EC